MNRIQILKETKTSIILELPKSLFKKATSSLTESSVLKIIRQGRKEARLAKTKAFASIKDLLVNA